ncbi:carboxypeptidase-like regulatory domain-containing protein [Formosa haliotis]|uniref:carboxypeptidase-like regulatory domain-containing protein n=1 Tax=Formosa haliotis TaxID=1555194 RepID=UPI000AA395DF|nr:carboxypeptidase-like regulatory domain-containing protein [Formosa haliotis]
MIRTLSIRCFLALLFCCQFGFSQAVEIFGKVHSALDVENIHVINNTSKLFTITNSKGEFKIYAKLNDTLVFSSIQYKSKHIVVDADAYQKRKLEIDLEEQVNQLDEVVVGKILTGDLLYDINNSDAERSINFYDLGIPGYTGRQRTQSERLLATAGEFKPIMLIGIVAGGMPLDPIINEISGRTKMLKKRVRLEAKNDLLRKIKSDLSDDFFSVYELDETLKTDFFYFCLESTDFYERCNGAKDVEILEYLKEKLVAYKKNLSSTTN